MKVWVAYKDDGPYLHTMARTKKEAWRRTLCWDFRYTAKEKHTKQEMVAAGVSVVRLELVSKSGLVLK